MTGYVRGRPTTRFERIPGKRAEMLDCLIYATAAKAGLALSASAFSQRADERRATAPLKPQQTVVPSRWISDGSEPW